jgi:putative ABC transport system ATP-binding protein
MASERNYPALSRIIRLLHGEKSEAFVVVVYAIGVSILYLAVPLAVQALVNNVSFASILQPIIILTILLFLALLMSALMQLMQMVVVESIQRRLFVRVALDVSYRTPKFSGETFFQKYSQATVNRFLEIVTVQKSLSILLVDGVAVMLQIVLGLIILAFYHPIFSAFSLCISIILLGMFSLAYRHAIQTSIEESSSKYETLAWIEDLALHNILFRSQAGFKFGREYADRAVLKYVLARKKHFRILFTQKTFALLLQAIASSVLLGLGGYLVVQEQLSLGQLIAAELILTIVLNAAVKMTKQLEVYYDLAAATSKLDHLIEYETEESSGDFLEKKSEGSTLELQKLTIYSLAKIPLIENISLKLSPGKKILIIGANGVGKTQLIHALYGLNKNWQGSILYDGHLIEDLKPESLRSQISLTKGIEIFHGSIEENLRLGREDVSNKEIRDVLKAVQLEEKIRSLPEGLETILPGHRGALSKGEAYRLMLARALVEHAPVLFIDDTLDFIDEQSVEMVLKNAFEVADNRVFLVTTHNAQFAPWFDEAYVIRDKKLEKL